MDGWLGTVAEPGTSSSHFTLQQPVFKQHSVSDDQPTIEDLLPRPEGRAAQALDSLTRSLPFPAPSFMGNAEVLIIDNSTPGRVSPSKQVASKPNVMSSAPKNLRSDDLSASEDANARLPVAEKLSVYEHAGVKGLDPTHVHADPQSAMPLARPRSVASSRRANTMRSRRNERRIGSLRRSVEPPPIPETLIPARDFVYQVTPMPPNDPDLARAANWDEQTQEWSVRVWPSQRPT